MIITDQAPNVAEDTREIEQLALIRADYPSLYVASWIALIRKPTIILEDHCAIALPDGYAVHQVLPSGRLGSLVRRYRFEVTR